MAAAKSSASTAAARPAVRLYLETPVVADPAAIAPMLGLLLEEDDVAAVLLRLADAGEATLIERIKALAPVVQSAGVALLLDGHAGLVVRSGADGAHVTGSETAKAVLSSLKPGHIVGVGGLTSRHDAMVAGEDGADYVLFGEPGRAGGRPSADAIAERLAWWAEVFSPPCVGYAMTLAEAGLLARAGADFILLGGAVWDDPRGPQAALAEAAAAIATAHDMETDRLQDTDL